MRHSARKAGGCCEQMVRKLRNKKRKEEPGLPGVSVAADSTHSGAGTANFGKGPESKHEEASRTTELRA